LQVKDFEEKLGFRLPRFNSWDTSQLYSSGEITLLAVPEPESLVLLMLGLLVFAFILKGIIRARKPA
jgi:hypothetical protein